MDKEMNEELREEGREEIEKGLYSTITMREIKAKKGDIEEAVLLDTYILPGTKFQIKLRDCNVLELWAIQEDADIQGEDIKQNITLGLDQWKDLLRELNGVNKKIVELQ